MVLTLVATLVVALGADAVYRGAPTEERPYARSDLPVYLAGARAVLAGEDPFGAISERGWPYVYPATLAAALTPLAALPPRAAAGLWYALGVLALFGGTLAFREAVGRERGAARASLERDGLVLLLVALPAASALLRGQVGPLLLGLLGAAALCLARRRDVAAGLLVALAAAIKLTPALVLVGLLVARRWRAAGAGALGLVLWLVLVPAPFLGLGGSLGALERFGAGMVLRPLRDPGSEELGPERPHRVHLPGNQSLASQAIRRREALGPVGTPLVLGLLAAGVAGVSLLAAARAGPGPGVAALALLLAAPLLAAPIAWHHHHVLLFPALLVLARAGWGRARPVSGLPRAALAAFAALSLLHFAYGPLRPYGLLGLGTLVVFAAVAGVEFRRARQARSPRPSRTPCPS